jgi:hypothetical protein
VNISVLQKGIQDFDQKEYLDWTILVPCYGFVQVVHRTTSMLAGQANISDKLDNSLNAYVDGRTVVPWSHVLIVAVPQT